MNKRYMAWKEDKFGNYISKDRIFEAPNIKHVFSLLATEEGIEYTGERILLRLQNDSVWFVKLLSK